MRTEQEIQNTIKEIKEVNETLLLKYQNAIEKNNIDTAEYLIEKIKFNDFIIQSLEFTLDPNKSFLFYHIG